MASDENFFVLVHYRGSIKKSRSGIKFTDKDLLSVFLKHSTSFTEFQNTILQKLGLHGVKMVEKLFYRILIFVLRNNVKYDSFVISSDEDLQVIFCCRPQIFEVRTPELLAKLVDVVCSSGGSNRNPQSSGYPACSSSIPIGASSAVLMIVPEAVLVTFLSFTANLNRSGDARIDETRSLEEVAIVMLDTPIMVPIFGEGGVPDGIEDALQNSSIPPAFFNFGLECHGTAGRSGSTCWFRGQRYTGYKSYI
ncbi:hypothetical protein Ahy_A08g040072 isoform B [Arachis hypogaea]|uniref:Uncharacterized protein n=1 Tax=Arachis hypogaea TaxID=3818 RepID=A0A445BY46_ARAHY|nr:hypothetical protein Ahy_A08g040072 isoform B [Arachis hypogaea]